MLDVALLAPQTTRKLRREEYERLVAMGAFEDERIELIEGELVTMSPNYPERASPVQTLTELYRARVGAGAGRRDRPAR